MHRMPEHFQYLVFKLVQHKIILCESSLDPQHELLSQCGQCGHHLLWGICC